MLYYFVFQYTFIHCIKNVHIIQPCIHNPTLEPNLPKRPSITLETYNPFLFPQQHAFTLTPSIFAKPVQAKTATILNQFASLFFMLHKYESASNMYQITSYSNSAKFSSSLEKPISFFSISIFSLIISPFNVDLPSPLSLSSLKP